MYVKKCPYCYCKSYSSGKKGKWRCPVCKSDITDVKAKVAKEDE